MVLGKHTLKAGVDMRIRQANNLLRAIPSGSFSFAAGLTGNPQQPAGTGSGFATLLKFPLDTVAPYQKENISASWMRRAAAAEITWPKRAFTCRPAASQRLVVSMPVNCVWLNALYISKRN